MEELQSHVTKCRCGHDRDHNATFHYWPDSICGDDFTISTSLNHYLGFWARLVIGIKYVLGVDNTYYHYTESTLDKQELIKLQTYINDVAGKFKE